MLEHEPGDAHPERPDRLRRALEALKECGIPIAVRSPRQATQAELESLHAPAYVETILALDGQSRSLDPDTAVSPGSVQAALLAAGATIELVDCLLDPAEPDCGLALGRPPGHHAERDRAMGFCLFGNIALAAVHAVDVRGLERVMIIDWDVHHGNGTQHLLESRGDIMVVSLHQEGIFPGTGADTEIGIGDGEGATVNIPMPGGCGGDEYIAAFQQLVVPLADRFRPDLVLVSAGFDGHAWDPLAGQELQTTDFAAMCDFACQIAAKHSGGRIGLVLEGGYDLDALSESLIACVRVLSGDRPVSTSGKANRARKALERAKSIHSL